MISRLLKQDFVKQGCVITEQLFGINYYSWKYQLKLSNLRLQNISSHQYYVVNCEDSIYNLLWIIMCIAWCRSLVYSVHQQQRYCSLVPSQLYENIIFSTFLPLQCLSWYNLVTTLHPIISYSFWNNRQGAHKPYRVCCSRCSYISWLCLHYETCDITGVISNLWVWLHNAILFPHPMFWLLCLHVVCLFLSLCIFVLYEAIMIIWICISIWI